MTSLVWLNIPLCAIAFIATVGIPLRLVLTGTGENAGPGARRRDGRSRERDHELAA